MNEIERAIGAAVASVVAFLALIWRTWINPMKIEAADIATWRGRMDVTVTGLTRRQDRTDVALAAIQRHMADACTALGRIEGRLDARKEQ